MCLGLNYVDHIKEGGYDILEYRVIFHQIQGTVL